MTTFQFGLAALALALGGLLAAVGAIIGLTYVFELVKDSIVVRGSAALAASRVVRAALWTVMGVYVILVLWMIGMHVLVELGVEAPAALQDAFGLD